MIISQTDLDNYTFRKHKSCSMIHALNSSNFKLFLKQQLEITLMFYFQLDPLELEIRDPCMSTPMFLIDFGRFEKLDEYMMQFV